MLGTLAPRSPRANADCDAQRRDMIRRSDERRQRCRAVTSSDRRSFAEYRDRSRCRVFPGVCHPLFLERVFGRAIVFVEDAEDAGKWDLRQLVGGELVGDVVAKLVLRGVVLFLFLDQREGAAFARVGRVEGAGEKFDAFAQAFDHGEAVVIHRALDHLDHVVDLRGVRARDEGGAGGDELFHRVDRRSIAPVGSVFALKPIGDVGDVCFFVRP